MKRTTPIEAEETVIKSLAHSSGLFFADMLANLFGDGSAVFGKKEANFFERCTFIKFCLDHHPVF